ncbi:MAG: response regulator transcription factor [Anaerolineae bacterium]|nr:response regulator transcription factor [Anaerolineae bacterium]MCO5188561.1 response regulator transcription factor [Anaerolineae bacterium]MCO5194990.1 response regulator transcription factor [Anaerolineae bacterium]MCO5198969.1 response regulator transcription factor [Anaerolineae bacterium]MCO5204896.1 response regulator transcription factor [Anaerolineae bacterium]
MPTNKPVKSTILVVEDNQTLLDTVMYNLEQQEYNTLGATSGYVALDLMRQKQPDLIVLDLMLPGMDGFDVCRRVRKESNVPIIMLTARDHEIDKVTGLELGADDYMTKPFSMRELITRVKVMLRRDAMLREQFTQDDEVNVLKPLTFDNLTIDPSRREVTVNNEVVHLKPKEYELLLFMAHNRGVALSRDLLLERVWDWTHSGSTRTVDVHIRWLREKIEPTESSPRHIVTVRGLGYRFE